jgi:hypothetical protein
MYFVDIDRWSLSCCCCIGYVCSDVLSKLRLDDRRDTIGAQLVDDNDVHLPTLHSDDVTAGQGLRFSSFLLSDMLATSRTYTYVRQAISARRSIDLSLGLLRSVYYASNTDEKL